MSVPQSSLLLRLGLGALGSWLLWVAFAVFPATAAQRGWVILVVVLYVAAFAALLIAAFLSRRLERRARPAILLVTLLAVTGWFAAEVRVFYPHYRADTLVLTHVAAEQFLQGKNPYTLRIGSLGDQLQRFGPPYPALTAREDGSPIERLVAHPALHFLAFVPALALGVEDLRWVVLLVEIVGLVVIFRWTPAWLQPLIFVPLWVNPDALGTFTSGSLTDWLWATPLLLAAAALARGRPARAGAWFGLACAAKQQPWVALPFVVVWLVRTAPAGEGSWSRTGRFLGAAAGVFLLVNLPFILAAPADWTAAVLTPFIEPLALDGHGLAALARLDLLPASRPLFAAISGAVAVVLLGGFWAFFDRVRNALWMLPAIAMWFFPRSFHNYLIYWVPVSILWVVLHSSAPSVRDERRSSATPRVLTRASFATAAVVSLAVVVLGLSALSTVRSAQHQLVIRVLGVFPGAEPGLVEAISVEVTNRFEMSVRLEFAVSQGGLEVPWRVESGPASLPSGAQARFIVSAPAGSTSGPVVSTYGMRGGRTGGVRLRVTVRETGFSTVVSVPAP